MRPPWEPWPSTARWARPNLSTHALQIILFGPLTYNPNIILGSLQIESLQLALSVRKTRKKGQELKPLRPCRGERLLEQTWFTSVWVPWPSTARWPKPSLSAHALQIILFGPLTYNPNIILESLQIESLQETYIVKFWYFREKLSKPNYTLL